MQNKYCATYNSQKEPSFLVHTEKGIVKFKENEDVIYAINMKDIKEIKNIEVSHVNTVADNLTQYSQKQRNKAGRKSCTIHWECLP